MTSQFSSKRNVFQYWKKCCVSEFMWWFQILKTVKQHQGTEALLLFYIFEEFSTTPPQCGLPSDTLKCSQMLQARWLVLKLKRGSERWWKQNMVIIRSPEAQLQYKTPLFWTRFHCFIWAHVFAYKFQSLWVRFLSYARLSYTLLSSWYLD